VEDVWHAVHPGRLSPACVRGRTQRIVASHWLGVKEVGREVDRQVGRQAGSLAGSAVISV